MGEIIDFKGRFQKPTDNLASLKPWEFRRADWETPHFIQMLKSQSAKLETHRQEVYKEGHKGIRQLPPHFVLKGGMGYTIRAAYAYRGNEETMREVYYLTGLVDCMINQVNPLLRTDLLRAMYKEIFRMKKALNTHWYGSLDQVLLPIDAYFYNEPAYRSSLRRARTMKELYRMIRKGTDEMFDILALQYVFYSPGVGG